MAYIEYTPKRFRPADLSVIEEADAICRAFVAQGFTLSLRQLYYQFVQRNLLPNKEASYDRLGRLVSDGRLAGLIDWDHIVDRTRHHDSVPHWDDPSDIMRQVARQFRTDKWADQPYYIEAWVEKEALIDVIERPARRLDIPWFACRGYASQSSQHEAADRFVAAVERGQQPLILHLGDHDPSGIDMSRDIYDRINLFVGHDTGEEVEVNRLALNMEQVRRYNPPPNPAKSTDSRFRDYARTFGDESWELDALDPPTIDALITTAVVQVRDEEKWAAQVAIEDEHRLLLTEASERWTEVADLVRPEDEDEDD